MAKNAVKNVVHHAAQRPHRAEPTPPAPDREIESWLGELRGNQPPKPEHSGTSQPSAAPTRSMTPAPEDATTAIPTQAERAASPEDVSPTISAEETRAIPVSRPESADTDVATEKLNARGKNEGGKKEGGKKEGEERRRGGGVSAQDLLRREGRL